MLCVCVCVHALCAQVTRVVEQWGMQFTRCSPRVGREVNQTEAVKVLYRHFIVYFRALFTLVLLLPASKVHSVTLS